MESEERRVKSGELRAESVEKNTESEAREAARVVELETGAATPTAPKGRNETPLADELYDVLVESCRAHGVPLGLGLGLIEVESGFRVDAGNGLCYGLCQLNRGYFPAALSPADNVRAGMAYLGSLLEQYEGDTAAALRAYNRGHDDGERGYSEAVLAAAGRWGT